MRRVRFCDVLEEALNALQGDTAPAGDRYVYLPQSAAPFLFIYSRGAGLPKAGAEPAGAVPWAPQAATRAARACGHAPSASPRPATAPAARELTLRQQRALDELIALGAELTADFTAATLRRAFRVLARRYHPDRHPDCTPVDHARLSRLFAGLTDNYRCLLKLIDQEQRTA
jgi:hypothetical protein